LQNKTNKQIEKQKQGEICSTLCEPFLGGALPKSEKKHYGLIINRLQSFKHGWARPTKILLNTFFFSALEKSVNPFLPSVKTDGNFFTFAAKY
jgi:hypothetical protein